eukprot:2678368-Karenia_brevis.AAC.1
MDITLKNDSAAQYVDILDQALLQHYHLFMSLYGIDAAIPKLHAAFHISKWIRKLGQSFTCFKMERMHHDAKSV